MTTNLTSDRVALITGGSGGIGRVAAEKLAATGDAVALLFSGNQQRADEAVAAISQVGGRATTIRADIADETQMAAAFDQVEQEFGGIDVVVNTAGIMLLSPVAQLDLADLDRMHRTNIRGTFVVSQLAARRLRSGGALINFSTSVTRLQTPGYAAYAASKAAVEAVTLILARELQGRDITVNTVAPGPTATPLFLEGKPQELIERIAGMNPMGRLGTAEDIAEAVAFLAGPAGRWTNGQTLFVNGGVA
ncbi:SDR family oxidoreductase [Jatrophihabitans sp. DSM 44399]|uniref:SDR family oxidoreductase n=1 Tax=Jatrophihabitans lederbergiae TaxID=3075547 RepID=A0ABU2JH47_9ACTN|nr:SDR family oxidoreductase [Jatrophihabitans sp. DSM 44399]MDT0263558.1 SDR family oxidoreductase [Jatrophihabitans sp. DSM 44399]